jgi:hypothetical protein
MKSLNENNTLWNARKQDNSLHIVGPNCCWVIGCCWYWYGMAAQETGKPEPAQT